MSVNLVGHSDLSVGNAEPESAYPSALLSDLRTLHVIAVFFFLPDLA
ncbi:hypothetical protein [Pleurocapsa sp. CCALA 161]|nr:hypothetical protein [Pleurocapsa sp. CCALA 161]